MTSLIRTVHPALVLSALQAAGFDAWEVPPSTRLHGGCSDPEHCPQHPLTHTGRDGVTRPVYGIETDAPGRKAHRVITAAWKAALQESGPGCQTCGGSCDPTGLCGGAAPPVAFPCARCGAEAYSSGHEVCQRCLDEIEGYPLY